MLHGSQKITAVEFNSEGFFNEELQKIASAPELLRQRLGIITERL